MFDNIGTALVQAIGFFGVFGYFVYQLLSDGKKPIKNKSISPLKKVNQKKDLKDRPKTVSYTHLTLPTSDLV